MKVSMLLVLFAGLLAVASGCRTPAYTASERHAQIRRNWQYEARQITDDWDHLWLLRPASRLTVWNVR